MLVLLDEDGSSNNNNRLDTRAIQQWIDGTIKAIEK